MMRITVTLPDPLLKRCEMDAETLQVSLSMYFRRLAEDRHGLSKITVPPPRGVAPVATPPYSAVRNSRNPAEEAERAMALLAQVSGDGR
jgi:hypothetical protein